LGNSCVIAFTALFTKGMFFDGLTYASIARNINEGIGTLWVPSYTPTIHPEFYEHPPFSFGCTVYSIDYLAISLG